MVKRQKTNSFHYRIKRLANPFEVTSNFHLSRSSFITTQTTNEKKQTFERFFSVVLLSH